MVFFDTCIWIELCGVRTPELPNEIRQASAASNLLSVIRESGKRIITCKEQLIEVVSAIQKVKMREYNKVVKSQPELSKVGNLKEFRRVPAYANVQSLCRQVCLDVKHFCDLQSIGEYSVDDILDKIHLADLNDCMYYDYCSKKGIVIYTFDVDYKEIDVDDIVSVI